MAQLLSDSFLPDSPKDPYPEEPVLVQSEDTLLGLCSSQGLGWGLSDCLLARSWSSLSWPGAWASLASTGEASRLERAGGGERESWSRVHDSRGRVGRQVWGGGGQRLSVVGGEQGENCE